jgi:adenylate cyclase
MEQRNPVDALVREQLRGEQQRALIVLAVFGALVTIGFTAVLIAGDVLGEITGDSGTLAASVAAVVGFLALEAALGAYFGRARRRAEAPRRIVFVTTTVIESLAPTVLIFVLSRFIPAGQAVDAPPMLIYFVLIILSTLRLDPKLSVLTGVVCGAGYLVVGLMSIDAAETLGTTNLDASPLPHVARSMMMVASGIIAGFVSREILSRQRLAEELRGERRRIVDIFGQHVSPQVVDTLLARRSEITTETRRVCVMFLDIRDFTTFSETRTPDQVVGVLNRLFEPLVDVVSSHHGIINKFLGDGFMAIFGAPVSDGQDTENAVRAALEMIEAVDGLRTDGTIPDVEIGIALHSGDVTTGTVGSRRRKEYTVIGDTVNVASRLEGLNTRFASRLIVSGEVWNEVGDRFPDLESTEIEPVQVKGRSRPVSCYRLVGMRTG